MKTLLFLGLFSSLSGTFRLADAGVSGATVQLRDESGHSIQTTATDERGRFNFVAVAPGDRYVVNVQYGNMVWSGYVNELRADEDRRIDGDIHSISFCNAVHWRNVSMDSVFRVPARTRWTNTTSICE